MTIDAKMQTKQSIKPNSKFDYRGSNLFKIIYFPRKYAYQNHIKHAPYISHTLSTNTRVYQSVVICTVYKSNMLTNISRAAANESVTVYDTKTWVEIP